MLGAHVEVEYGSIHRGDGFFFDECQGTKGKRQTNCRHPPQARFATAVRRRKHRKEQHGEKIATDLENFEANLKGSTCAQRSKKHGVGTHSQTGEREETVNVFKQAQKQHAKELQMKRTEEEEATATTKLVTETGGRGKMKDNCVWVLRQEQAAVRRAVSSPWKGM